MILIFSGIMALAATSSPVVNITSITQHETSRKVNISYNLSHTIPVTVTLQVSADNGVTWNQPCTLVAGDIGANISPGNGKYIVWDVLTEHPDTLYENVRFKVMAVDGQSPPELPNFTLVPGGTFIMGRTRGNGDSDELPTHSVTLDAFYIGKYEVTQAEWMATMGNNPASGYGVGDTYPVYYITWYEILKYCNLRSMAEGLTPVYSILGSTDPNNWGSVPTSNNSTWDAVICNWSSSGYRMPTEAEWEYAARGASNDPDYLYSGSDFISNVAWYGMNNYAMPVGTKAPNSLGVFDMSGNVWEWCWDWWGNNYYSSCPQIKPLGPSGGVYRVARGGSWLNSADVCRVVKRSKRAPYSGLYIGVRLCRTVF